MAVALAKVLRGGGFGSSSHLLPAIGRRVTQQGLLPGFSPATPTVGSRLVHTGEGALIRRMSERFRNVNRHFEAQQIGKIPEDSRETLDVPSGDDPDRADNDDHHYG